MSMAPPPIGGRCSLGLDYTFKKPRSKETNKPCMFLAVDGRFQSLGAAEPLLDALPWGTAALAESFEQARDLFNKALPAYKKVRTALIEFETISELRLVCLVVNQSSIKLCVIDS